MSIFVIEEGIGQCQCHFEEEPTHLRGDEGCEGNCFDGCICRKDVADGIVLCDECKAGQHQVCHVPCDD